ncbi:TetR family transcriptional regulator [Caproicibacter fermentans]|uniref:TetR family transcriptional regulator n=1 Tax=Caproicibacter fermentans TaxID=2576756 RepID=A0A7G8T718_9FIRM|nr:TetR family transcriptional regulator [Caproicibacter fermentans]QNK39409.1 TetR family transcriptional regulator [Caproicibacter fermentans]
MPKQKTSKEEILRAAFRVLREQGAGELNARRIAEEAGVLRPADLQLFRRDGRTDDAAV